MHKQITLVLATLALSAAAFGQTLVNDDSPLQIGYAANLTLGDSIVNISNDGFLGGPATGSTVGNICANVYVFDPAEEEVACCYCLTTPDGLYSLSAQKSLISMTLTPAIPTSIVIKVTGTQPTAADGCNPATVPSAAVGTPGSITHGLLLWGTTLEPNSSTGVLGTVPVTFKGASLNTGVFASGASGGEIGQLASLCSFIQLDGTGYGICKGCSTGALSGSKN